MSYSILYRSMFIKMSDGRFIPMMEMGDNNVWECNYGHGRNRRVRSWSNIRLNKKQKFFTEEEIKNFLEGWNNEFEDKRQKHLNSDDEWDRKMAETANFGYYEAISVYGKGGTHGTKFNDVKNIVLGGIKNCISLQDAVEKCNLKITYWENGVQRFVKVKTEEDLFNFDRDNDYYFTYDSNSSTDFCFKYKKALSGFEKITNKGHKYRLSCCDNLGHTFYVWVKGGNIILIDDIDKASVFDKQISNGLELHTIIFRLFSDIKSIHSLYID